VSPIERKSLPLAFTGYQRLYSYRVVISLFRNNTVKEITSPTDTINFKPSYTASQLSIKSLIAQVNLATPFVGLQTYSPIMATSVRRVSHKRRLLVQQAILLSLTCVVLKDPKFQKGIMQIHGRH